MGRKTTFARGGEFILLAVLVLVVAVGYLALFRAQNTPREQPAVIVGEPVVLGSVEWTVTGVRHSITVVRKSDGRGPEGMNQVQLVTVDLSSTNRSNKEIELSPEPISLLDGDGVRYKPDTNSMRVLLENAYNMTYGEVGPDSTRQGQVIFSVPPGASDFVLEVEALGAFDSRVGRVDLDTSDTGLQPPGTENDGE